MSLKKASNQVSNLVPKTDDPGLRSQSAHRVCILYNTTAHCGCVLAVAVSLQLKGQDQSSLRRCPPPEPTRTKRAWEITSGRHNPATAEIGGAGTPRHRRVDRPVKVMDTRHKGHKSYCNPPMAVTSNCSLSRRRLTAEAPPKPELVIQVSLSSEERRACSSVYWCSRADTHNTLFN